MSQLLEERENWGSRGGFVLAAIGSAVGLGNLWGFPYKLYSYGGGAFLVPYIFALFAVGLPILILEFSMGHFTQRAAPNAFKRCGRAFEYVGWLGLAMCVVIISYYPVILAYCFSYFWYSIVGIFNGGNLPWAGQGLEGVQVANEFFFNGYINYSEGFSLGAIQWQVFAPLLITWILMYLCIFKGVNLVGKIVWITVPVPWLMLLVLTIRGLTLEGSVQGLAYYLTPTWTELAKPTTWRYAFGQVFFSMSVSYGVMITYSSFLHKKSDLNNNAAIITISDFATSFMAGVAIFATLGGMAFVTSQAGEAVAVDKVAKEGVSLAFIAFPYALAQLPYSAWFSFFFFLALITLGIDSAFSITETILAGVVDKTGLKRSVVLPVITLLGLVGSLLFTTRGGLNWIDVADGVVNGTWGISLLGLMECIAIGWYYRLDILRLHTNERSDWRIGAWWDVLIRIVLPLFLGTLFFWNLYDDFNAAGGFLTNSEGNLAVDKLAAMIITLAVFGGSLAVTIAKTKNSGLDTVQRYHRAKHSTGSVLRYFVAGLAVLLIGLSLLIGGIDTAVEKLLTLTTVVIGLAIVVSAHCRIKKDVNDYSLPDIFNSSGAVMALFGVCSALTAILCTISGKIDKADTQKVAVAEELSGISYLLLILVFMIVVVGLGWCFYRAITAVSRYDSLEQGAESI